MMKVKEISKLTGISVRTLHYYDEIGLFKPSGISEAGYRLYDDKALETLQQILFFREFDIPLKTIKAIMENPALERNQVLLMQKKMLLAKKARVERLLASIDEILKGDNKMDFAIFTKTELEEMFRCMFDSMPEEMRQCAIREFGSEAQWKEHYIHVMSSDDAQKRYAKIIEWYGGKEAYMGSFGTPLSKEAAESFAAREDAIRRKLISKKGSDINSFPVREIIGEYGFVMKQLCHLKHEDGMMLALASSYRNDQVRSMVDEQYGAGAAEYFAQAIEAFYSRD